jgi:hypothetical protein
MKMFIIAGAVLLGTVMGQAESGVVQSGPQPSSSDAQSQWTPERMKQAKPVDVGREGTAPRTPSVPPTPPGNLGAAGGMLPSR